MKTTIICLLCIFITLTLSFAHGGKKHKNDSANSTVALSPHQSGDSLHRNDEIISGNGKVTADLDDFPTLHPMVVHFAIVLIILAAILQLVNLLLVKKEVSWIITAILLVGVVAAWAAGRNFHPHTHGLSEHAQQVLDQHDKWADWTINFGIFALLLQIANLFLLSTNRLAMGAIAGVLALSAYSVACAGHYGSQLVHIEGIGPQGKNLEMHHHH